MEETPTTCMFTVPVVTVADFISLMDKARPVVIRQGVVTLPEEAAWDVVYKTLTDAMGAK